MQATRKEKEGLTETLDKQEISTYEVQKMGHERKMLEESLMGLAEQKESLQREIWDQEMLLAKDLDATEKHVQSFNEAAMKLGLFPATSKNANGTDFNLKLISSASMHREMTSLDLTKSVKPALNALKLRLGEEFIGTQKKLRELGHKATRTTDLLTDQREKVEGLQARCQKLEDTYRSERDMMNKELKDSVSKVEDVELELHRLKSAEKMALSQCESALAQVELEIQQVREMQEEERERLNGGVCAVMDEVASHKVHVTEMLEQLELQSRQAKEVLLDQMENSQQAPIQA